MFIPAIKQIVGPYLLEPAPFELDAKQATDLIVFDARDKKIAARVREESYIAKYSEQFTIRSRRESGSMTELEKIQRGFGDWLFYGFGHEKNLTIDPWYIIDLDIFRYYSNIETWKQNGIKCGERSNGDGTFFKYFEIFSFPDDPPLLVASSIRSEISEFLKENL